MGIQNFCKLINELYEPADQPAFFDAILFDVQCFLHIKTGKHFREIYHKAWQKLEITLSHLLYLATTDNITLVLSFDGEGVPMKTKKGGRNYRMDITFQHYIVKQLKRFRFPVRQLQVYLSGCNVPGEGEHKLFQIAEALKTCQHPIVVSDDQDVFILSLMRLERYQTVQIHRYGKYYQVTHLYRECLPYPITYLEVVSFLFGNDFIPALVTISTVSDIHQSLIMQDSDHPADILACFIQSMSPYLRYTTHKDESLVEKFWITYFWFKDYCTRSMFPQKFLENPIYHSFNRNALLTELATPNHKCFERAQQTYKQMQPVNQAAVFGPDVLDQLTLYHHSIRPYCN